jgi:hypothetical protein
LITDSESFYASIITLLEDPDEQEEVHLLLAWWDRYELWLWMGNTEADQHSGRSSRDE